MNARHILTIARKELRGIRNERTIVLAILLQVFIAMFSSFLVVGLTTLYDPSSLGGLAGGYAVGYAGADSPLDGLLEEKGFSVHHMDLSDAVASLSERKLAAAVWVPDTPPDAAEPVKITLYTVKNDISASVTGTRIREALETYEGMLRDTRSDRLDVLPIEVAIPSGSGGQGFFIFIYGLLVPLLLFMPAIISASLIIDFITEEYSARTLETLLSTPLTFSEILWGKVFAAWVLVPVQAGAWLILLAINGITIANVVPVLLHVAVASLALILIGAIAALHYRERTSAQFIYSTALVAVLLVVLSVPGNPVNLVVLLAAGTAVPAGWTGLLVVGGGATLLALFTERYARRIARTTTP
ncbi:ABC transporter permease [Methanofollis fontis]|uniref:Sodium ABC transporter permease n=1 Tax=Methanofollis fontis TaxID=2052832 RepID=A0A483CKN2_9EURY|nr:ABC transporter permease [Methanofollis fontis]TAJ43452.1 sodium ABC transporter permease [Methanofollis fontis]